MKSQGIRIWILSGNPVHVNRMLLIATLSLILTNYFCIQGMFASYIIYNGVLYFISNKISSFVIGSFKPMYPKRLLSGSVW